MNRIIGHVQKPVFRTGGETYILYTLLSFGASVALTRLFLELAGYPQLGGSTLHIAHVLWGGLALFVAALLPLIYANRWAYTGGALLAGIGVGLFIDEVGKFITQTNDYFFPGAAPIIYAFFLVTVLIYLQLRKPRNQSPRGELYRALDGLSEVLDHDLEPDEFATLLGSLQYVIAHSKSEEYVRLAKELLEFLSSGAVQLTPELPSFLERAAQWWQRSERRWLNQVRFRWLLAAGLLVISIYSLTGLALEISSNGFPHFQGRSFLEWFRYDETRDSLWLLSRLIIEGATTIFLFLAGIAFSIRKENLGVRLAFFSLIISLAVTNLLVFYYDQFSTIGIAVVQLILLIGVLRYRRFFLKVSGGE